MIRSANTKYGTLNGKPGNDQRVTVFKGIPYAKPPVGELRWKAPKPCGKWEGSLDAYDFAAIAVQDTPGLGTDIYCKEWHVDPEIAMSEDCLYLNVWTGAKSEQDKLPVLVWYYGGAFQWGYTAELEFNGEQLARHDVIVVSIGYRLGAFGFLAHPELTAQDPDHPTNFGLLDQRLGLEWVYENIAAFGGDPEKITIAGQSAGGGSVLFHMANFANKKYVKNATIFSGLIRCPYWHEGIVEPRTIEEVESDGCDFLKSLGVSSIEDARALDALAIRDAYALFRENHAWFAPSIDGKYVLGEPFEMLNRGECLDIPLFTGYTGNEFITEVPCRNETEDYNAILCKLESNTEILHKDGKTYFNMVENTVKVAMRNHIQLLKKNVLSENMYVYRFNPDIPGDDNPGAFHSCDLWFFFDNIPMCHRAYNGAHYDLSLRMSDYFTNFIKTGDPNGKGYDGKELPKWGPVYDKKNQINFEG